MIAPGGFLIEIAGASQQQDFALSLGNRREHFVVGRLLGRLASVIAKDIRHVPLPVRIVTPQSSALDPGGLKNLDSALG